MIYGPKFKVFEVNNLVGLRNGHIIAQSPAATTIKTKTYEEYKFIENGLILGLGADGKLDNYDATKHALPLVHYTEELITFGVGLDKFAVEVPNGDYSEAFPRAIALYIGDTFTTDNVDATAVTTDGKVTVTSCYAKVVGGVITLEAAASNDTLFRVTVTTMPAGGIGYECEYYKNVTAAKAN